MLNDILYCILIYTNIDTLKNCVCVNKYTNQLLKTKYFWFNKFIQNNITLYNEQKKFNNWLIEYKKCQDAYHITRKVLKLYKHPSSPYYKLTDNIILVCNYQQTLFILNFLIVTQKFNNINGLNEMFLYFNTNVIRPYINLIFYYNFDTEEITLYYTKEEVIQILQFLFYTYPSITIKNVMGQTFKFNL